MAEPNSQDRRLSGRTKLVRCPYCTEAGAFKTMAPAEDGDRHCCARCGHTALVTNPQFECACAKCRHLRGPAFRAPHSIQ